MLLIGSRHRHLSCSEAFPVRAVRIRRGRPEGRPRRPGLLSWGSSIAPPPTRPSLRFTRLGRRPDFGSGLPRPEHVPLLPFLPASAVSSAASGSEDPLVRLSAGLLHPAAGHGVHHVSDFLLGLSTERRPEGRGPRGPSRSRPLWRRPFEAFPSSAAGPCRHRVSSFRTRSRSPTGVPSRRSEPRPLPCRHGALRCSPTSGLSSAEESVAMRATLPLRARSMLPWALDRLVSRCCRARRAAQRCWTFHLAARTALVSLDPNVEGRQGVSALSGSCDPSAASVPEGMIAAGRGGSGISRRRRLGRTPPRAPKDRWNASGSAPRGGPTASAPAPEGVGVPASSRRISEETRTRPSARSEERRPVVRARAPHPSAVARVPDGETARRTHARPEACARARHSRAPRRVLRRTPRRAPEGVRRAASRGRHPEVDPWRLVTPASPASWRAGSGQTVIVFTGTAETRSEDEVPPPIRRSE